VACRHQTCLSTSINLSASTLCIYRHFSEKGSLGFAGLSEGDITQKVKKPKSKQKKTALHFVLTCKYTNRLFLCTPHGLREGVELCCHVCHYLRSTCGLFDNTVSKWNGIASIFILPLIYIASDYSWLSNNKRIWKEDIMAKCKILSRRMTQRTGNNDDKNTG